MPQLPFFTRLWMAWVCFFQILFRPAFATAVFPAYDQLRRGLPPGAPTRTEAAPAPSSGKKPAAAPARPAEPPAEERHRAGLFLLSLLQREGRLVDFVQEEVAPFSDADVGAAARIVHEGCRKVLRQYLELAPVMKDGEGAAVQVPAGFDAQRIRLTGNVTGQAPYRGTLRHGGWMATSVRLPAVPEALDPRVIAPAEVELP